jgi:hypothetical protein
MARARVHYTPTSLQSIYLIALRNWFLAILHFFWQIFENWMQNSIIVIIWKKITTVVEFRWFSILSRICRSLGIEAYSVVLKYFMR